MDTSALLDHIARAFVLWNDVRSMPEYLRDALGSIKDTLSFVEDNAEQAFDDAIVRHELRENLDFSISSLDDILVPLRDLREAMASLHDVIGEIY